MKSCRRSPHAAELDGSRCARARKPSARPSRTRAWPGAGAGADDYGDWHELFRDAERARKATLADVNARDDIDIWKRTTVAIIVSPKKEAANEGGH